MPRRSRASGVELATVLVRLGHVVQNVFSDVGRTHALTPQQIQALCQLVDGPVGMGELARGLHLERSSLTGLVDRLERRGLVARVRDTPDRRACRIALSTSGVRLAERAHADVVARLAALSSDLPATDRRHLAATLDSLLPQRNQ